MNKKIKLYTIFTIAGLMIVSWAIIYFMDTIKTHPFVNYWWQIFMGLAALIYAGLGILTSGKWSWLKSGVGRGVFFISLALLMWGIGQMGWSYYLFANPNVQSPPSHLLDIADFSAIPLWFIGVIMLSKATGARYGLRTRKGQLIVIAVSLVMTVASYYFLVEVARGGTAYFKEPFWEQFFDLGYSIGDAIIATIAIAIYVLSWKILGGRFKIPILLILVAFIFLYFADFFYSYLAGRNTYYNGDLADLLYMITISIFGLGVNLLDPDSFHRKKPSLVPHAAGNTPPVQTPTMQPPLMSATNGLPVAPVPVPQPVEVVNPKDAQ